MKKYILFLILAFFNSNMFADTNIFGYWLTSGSIVKIENCNNLVCGKIITVFEPHRYSRVMSLKNEFAKCFSQSKLVIMWVFH